MNGLQVESTKKDLQSYENSYLQKTSGEPIVKSRGDSGQNIETLVICSFKRLKVKASKRQIANIYKYLAVDQKELDLDCCKPSIVRINTSSNFEIHGFSNFIVRDKKRRLLLFESTVIELDNLRTGYCCTITKMDHHSKQIVVNKLPALFVQHWLNNKYWIFIFREAIEVENTCLKIIDLNNFYVVHNLSQAEFDFDVMDVLGYEENQLAFVREQTDEHYQTTEVYTIVDLQSKTVQVERKLPSDIYVFSSGFIYWIDFDSDGNDVPPLLVKFEPSSGHTDRFSLHLETSDFLFLAASSEIYRNKDLIVS